MHVRPISIPRSTSPHAAAPAQPHRRARLRACCNRGSHGRPRLCRSGQDTVQTHVVFFIHVSALLDQVRHQLDHALLSRIKERMLGSVLAQRCLDLLLLDLITAVFGPVERSSAVLKRAGVSAGAWGGGATATRAASAGGDALPRRAPCTPDTHQRKHIATGHACADHLHPSLYLAARCCPGTATQTRTIACTHLHAYHGAHTHGMQALARTPPRQHPRHARGTYLVRRRYVGAELQQRLHHRSMPASGG